MFGPINRISKFRNRKNKSKSKRRSSSAGSGSRPLRFESLEDRRVLAAGIVDVDVFSTPGTLFLDGDTSNNDVEIRQTPNIPNSFDITGKNGTLLTLNDFNTLLAPTFTSLTVNGITGDISVDLNSYAVVGGGVDKFTFVGTGALPSSVPRDLLISNTAGSNTNILEDVLVNRDLIVTADADGYRELQIVDSEIIGSTIVDNTGVSVSDGGFNGDTKTVIDNSKLRAGTAGPAALPLPIALQLINGIGMDDFSASGNSQFGDGAPAPPGQTDPIVDIDNGTGASMTVFTGASKVYGPGTTTIYGDLDIRNLANHIGTLDVLTFNGVNVFGDVNVDNGSGWTETRIINSELFSDLLPGAQIPASPEHVSGAGVVIQNDAGFDTFDATDSILPWGLYINNDRSAGGVSTNGSRTKISGSQINTARGIAGPSGLTILGDAGADIVNIDPTIIRGTLFLNLRDGQNEAVLTDDSVVDKFFYLGGFGGDQVTIDNARVTAEIDIFLGDGADLMTIVNVDPLVDLPPVTGDIKIDGGNNAGDTLDTDFGPLIANIVNFEFFV